MENPPYWGSATEVSLSPHYSMRHTKETQNMTKYRLVCYFGLGSSSEQSEHRAFLVM